MAKKASESATEYLAEFGDEVRAFGERRLLTSGFVPNVDVTWQAARGVFEDRSNQPDVELYRSFLMDFRLFWATRERFYLRDVYPVLRDVITDPAVADRIADSEQRISALDDHPGTVIQIFRDPDGMERTLNNRELADWWIHGAYLHRSNTKKTQWWKGQDPFGRSLFEWHLREHVFFYSFEVFEMANVVAEWQATVSSGP